ncbi:hypothetical protein ACFXAO_27820 [Streptomyces lavendulae]
MRRTPGPGPVPLAERRPAFPLDVPAARGAAGGVHLPARGEVLP